MDYILSVLTTAAIYVILAVTANLIFGYTGMFSVAHAGFYGIGAYTVGILTVKSGLSTLLSAVVALLIAGLAGAVVAGPSLRLRGDYLVVTSFGLQVLVTSLLFNWQALTNGPSGLGVIPAINLFGLRVESVPGTLALAVVCAVLTCAGVAVLVRSPFGRVLRALRDDEVMTAALGKRITRFKVQVFALGAMGAGLAGVLYAFTTQYIAPDGFTIAQSIDIVILVVIGGIASVWGSVAGAVLYTVLPELLSAIGIPNSLVGDLNELLFGLVVIVLLFVRPAGVVTARVIGAERDRPRAGEPA